MDNLQTQIDNLRTLQESYDQIGAAAEAYNVGKTQLAQAITSKGVETSPTETYPEMAEKVAQIAQKTTIYEGADSYGKQLSADGALWDLYQVLADMKTRFMGTGDYAALIVCEYYKGYPSLVLQGADGYYTCDGDYYDYASPNHVWHDADNGKMNRWVAFLYRQEGARLDITNTDISPCSMYIGGHIGTIEYFVNGRLTDLVCGIEETDLLDNLLFKTFTQEWNKNILFNGIRNIDTIKTNNNVFVSLNGVNPTKNKILVEGVFNYVYVKLNEPFNYGDLFFLSGAGNNAAVGIEIEGEISGNTNYGGVYARGTNDGGNSTLTFIHASGFKRGRLLAFGTWRSLIDVVVGEMDGNFNMQSWNPSYLADADKKAKLIGNIKNGILARVSDATGSTQLVFTVSTNMYNNIASEEIEWQGETMSLADAFLTKNWLLAGA